MKSTKTSSNRAADGCSEVHGAQYIPTLTYTQNDRRLRGRRSFFLDHRHNHLCVHSFSVSATVKPVTVSYVTGSFASRAIFPTPLPFFFFLPPSLSVSFSFPFFPPPFSVASVFVVLIREQRLPYAFWKAKHGRLAKIAADPRGKVSRDFSLAYVRDTASSRTTARS